MKTLRNFAKLLSIVMILSIALGLIACQGSLALEAFTVDRSTVKTVYYVGEEIDFSGIRATVRYSDESLNTEYGIADLTITYDPDITATVGTKQVKVSFMDPHLEVEQSTVVQITVKEDPNAVKHSAYYIDASAVKTAYVIGETVDFTGIKVYERFSDSSVVEMTDLAPLSYSPTLDTLTATAGNKVVKIQYNGEDAGTVTVKVSDPEVIKNDVVSVVVGGSYKTTYEVGETVDLTGMTLTVTYKEGEVLTLTHEALTAENVDMSMPGTKTVVISFMDSINNEEDFTSISITVIKKDVVVQFEKPDTLSAFDSDNNRAGKTSYGQTGFSGEFLLGNQLYVIGDDNAFVMIPTIVVDDNGTDKDLEKFYSDVDIYVHDGSDYVLLEKSALSSTVYAYTLGDKTLVTVDTYGGEYQFTEPVDKVKISVKPSSEHYKNTESFNAVVLEAKVIDAYNVYNANELSVIDNSDRQGWIDFKTELGLNGITPAGVVLHNDINVKYTNVPADFFYKSNDTVQYRNTATGEIKEYSSITGMNYLVDETIIYDRISTTDFVIQGNFFTISVSDFPLIASPSIFGENSEKDYGTDYSNASLFRFATIPDPWVNASDVPVKSSVTVDNLAFIGNAGRDQWVVEKVHGDTIQSSTELVTAGGLILVKASLHATTTFNNVISNSFFITYMPDYQGTMYVNSSKCYDSYQNAAFVWADSFFELNDSYINGTGGPVIIAQSVRPSGFENYFNPQVYLNNTVTDTALAGDEIWFKAVGATGIIGQVQANGASLGAAGLGNWCNPNNSGKMNIKAALMNNAKNASEALTDVYVQGGVYTDGSGIDRFMTSETWYKIITHPALAAGAPFLVVHDAEGNPYVLYATDAGLFDLNGRAFNQTSIGTDMMAPPTEGYNHAAIYQAFSTADEIVLYQGGLAVLFEFYH